MRIIRWCILRGDTGELDAEVPQGLVIVGIGNRELPHGLGKRSREFQVFPGSRQAASCDQVGEKISGAPAREETREQPGNLLDIGLFAGHCLQKRTTCRQ